MDAGSSATTALSLAISVRVPVLLWGAPGTGKTSVVRSIAEAMGIPCETVLASIREPTDFSGLPVVHEGTVSFAPPAWAQRLAAAEQGLLFLDEISTAPPAVQAALLRVVLDRVVGDLPLPDSVAVVAAANPPDQAAAGWDLSPPLANRFCHLEWRPDARVVADGLVAGFDPPALLSVGDGRQGRSSARAAVAAFLSVRPSTLSAPPDDPRAAGRAWPSPRTWEMAAILLSAADASGAGDDVAATLVAGAVGDSAAIEFLTWRTEMDLPDPEAVLADPDSFVLPERGDRAYAALSAIASAVAAEPTPERWAAGWRVVGRAGERAPDVAALAARTLARCRPPGAEPPPEVKAFLPLLRDAGLL